MIVPLKHVAGINERSLPEDTDPDSRFRYIDIGAVGRGELVAAPEELRFEDAPSRARRLLIPGDTIVSTVRTYLRAVWPVSGDTSRLVASTGFAVLSPHAVNAAYFSWWARSDSFIEEVVARSVGVSYPAINALELGELPVRVPPPAEQRAIADFLDAETARIDALITKKRRLRDRLLEGNLAHANGYLSGSGPQDSGVPSIGGIPTHWKVRRNKTFMREVRSVSTTGMEEMLSVSHITGVTPRSEKTVYMFEAESTVGYKLVAPGDLVVNTMWAWMGAAGVSRHHGIVSPAYGVYRLDTDVFLPEYLDILVRTPAYICEMTRYSRGVTSSRLRLYPEELLSLSTPVPPLDDQSAIVGAVGRRAKIFKEITGKLDEQISLLQERRQALITAAVTGQIDIPGAAA